MKIVICPDSFKESLTAMQAANAIEEGWVLSSNPAIPLEVQKVPISDGGEGMMTTLVDYHGGEYVEVQVYHPIQEKGVINARYAWIPSKKLIVIESSQAIGLDLVPFDVRNPLYTSSYGLGQLLVHANNTFIKTGRAEHILLGIGGTSTVDGGIGLLQALGVKLLDEAGNPVAKSGIGLQDIREIDLSNIISFEFGTIIVASDVQNPLYGELGAATVFGPQKGASPEMVNELEQGMRNFAKCIAHTLQIDEESRVNFPCAGAAGGLGMVLPVFFNARIQSGIETIMKLVNFEQALEGADLVITGEGKTDGQSLQGKVVYGILQEAKRHNIPVIVISGALENSYETFYDLGVQSMISATPISLSWEDIKQNAYHNVKMTTLAVARIFYLGQNTPISL